MSSVLFTEIATEVADRALLGSDAVLSQTADRVLDALGLNDAYHRENYHRPPIGSHERKVQDMAGDVQNERFPQD